MSKENLDSDLWVDRYGDTLHSYTLVRVRDATAAEEIVQSTFVAALEASKSYEGRSMACWDTSPIVPEMMGHRVSS